MRSMLKIGLALCLASSIFAADNHQVGFKFGLTSIDNEDGWHFEKGSVFADFLYDTDTVIKPRLDLGYIAISEEDEGGVSGLLQLALNGVYDIDMRNYTDVFTPYLLAGIGYEHVFDDTDTFESHPFMQLGLGGRYDLHEKLSLVSEFRALQMFDDSNNNEDNEFALYVGIQVPLFVNVIRGRVDAAASLPLPEAETIVQNGLIDSDNDSVPDSMDKCPHTRAGAPVDVSGCEVVDAIVLPEGVAYLEDETSPAPMVVEPLSVQSQTPVVNQSMKASQTVSRDRRNLEIKFASNAATMDTISLSRLRAFAKYLKNDSTKKVVIEGYTDNSGDEAQNVILSTKRAMAVKDALIGYGIAASRIKAVGKGSLNPIATNDTEAGRAQNRRIEAVLY